MLGNLGENLTNTMKKLDMDSLVKNKYLKEKPNDNPNCIYSESGDLSEDGWVICSLHGGLTILGPYDVDENHGQTLMTKIKSYEYRRDCVERIPFAFFWPIMFPLDILTKIQWMLRKD